MSQETNNISSVLLEINKTIQIIGTEKLLELLKISRENDSNLGEDIKIKSQMIIQLVCDEFNINMDDFYSRTRKNNRRYAIGITAMILKEHLKLDVADISFLIKIHLRYYNNFEKKADLYLICPSCFTTNVRYSSIPL